jgi:hypothetical protein
MGSQILGRWVRCPNLSAAAHSAEPKPAGWGGWTSSRPWSLNASRAGSSRGTKAADAAPETMYLNTSSHRGGRGSSQCTSNSEPFDLRARCGAKRSQLRSNEGPATPDLASHSGPRGLPSPARLATRSSAGASLAAAKRNAQFKRQILEKCDRCDAHHIFLLVLSLLL